MKKRTFVTHDDIHVRTIRFIPKRITGTVPAYGYSEPYDWGDYGNPWDDPSYEEEDMDASDMMPDYWEPYDSASYDLSA